MDAELQTSEASEGTWLSGPPEELLTTKLRRLGEGVGKVVYASEHWVVKRERSPFEVVAIIVLWHGLQKLKRILPHGWIDWLMRGPSREIRLLRVMVQTLMLVIPKSLWFTTHVRKAWRIYTSRDMRGQRLADARLHGTGLIPMTVQFPPAAVRVAGWPGRLTVSSATERVESTLYQRLQALANTGKFDDIEIWLNRYLELRQSGWRRGLFSVDAHLKNYGVCGSRLVLLDTGGLTDRWTHILDHFSYDHDGVDPHKRLGLGALLKERPDVASRFDHTWKALVNPDSVRERWPSD
ncbi:MAG TPA: hypothetical protein VER03_20045 [Bryobacteraceae bacterium]|nr:hypothetical protein [Bryobacteraceae bacterium]